MIRHKILYGLGLTASVLCVCYLAHTYGSLTQLRSMWGTAAASQYGWTLSLLRNSMGYATVLLPLWLGYKYVTSRHYLDKPVNSLVSRVLHLCYADPLERLPESVRVEEEPDSSRGSRLAGCLGGLLGAYLVWGLLQEKIMTQNYILEDGSVYKFTDSQFLVFVNRVVALVFSWARLSSSGKGAPRPPLYKFSYCALTNIVSAWCQYEALKYVSFPTQVLSKSCKVVPVMVMGRVVSGARYQLWEYLSAILISGGMVLFLFTAGDHVSSSAVTTMSGIVLLCLYMVCDSFTSSWQGELFRQYQVSPLQMLCYVNMFSCLLTACSLLQHSSTLDSILLLQRPAFLADCVLLSAASCVGQALIYYTIKHFGAVVFTVIMTLRQALSILLSCLVFGHSVSAWGALGIVSVLAAVLLRLYAGRAGDRHNK